MTRTTTRGRASRFLAILSVVALAISGCGGAASNAGGPVEIRAAQVLPPGGSQSDLIAWFMSELEKRTDGQVKTDVTYGGGLLAGTDTLPGLQQGRAEAGNVVPAYFPAELPLNNINMVPISDADQSARLRALQDLADGVEQFEREFEQQQIELIGFLPNNASAVTFGPEVTSLADVEGLKIRIPAQPSSVVWEELGAKATFQASEEVYESVERGIVDGVTYPMDTQVANGITDVAKYMASDVGESGGSVFAFSSRTYERLPEDAKEVVEQLKKEWPAKADELMTKYDRQACRDFLESGGTIVRWRNADRETMKEAVERLAPPVWKAEAAKSVDRSVADELWQQYTDSLARHSGETGYVNGLSTCGRN
ncbi:MULTISPECIES: TRAP transporter substrate-binding protein [Prauserella salsuginis group]|uniref:TRAP transporter substrate-binding protein n=1 Tax=Prauserella salsuginis TaxID=387889 RepID=A0ABW6G4U4_9PSEU|nr:MULTISPECIES: TRAP transporter substrate-binding protein DctP [Prauserella salsuginis group]MCR3718779.1 TRAP-type C4-dicarboxylate transport system, substrate-binding protein [Prauserella flava]MCR3733349.1 TRAP-type C4-dicarboxylate transport system, substrate-binding protein [Prauserella salsuginis]